MILSAVYFSLDTKNTNVLSLVNATNKVIPTMELILPIRSFALTQIQSTVRRKTCKHKRTNDVVVYASHRPKKKKKRPGKMALLQDNDDNKYCISNLISCIEN